MNVTPTPAQEQAALAWLSLLHDQPSSGDQATFSRWLRADPAHVEAYAQAQVLWELSEVPARQLADEDALALQATSTRSTPQAFTWGALVRHPGDGCKPAADGGDGRRLAAVALGR